MKPDWKSFWHRKGTEDTTDLLILDGYKYTGATPTVLAEHVQDIQDTLGIDENSTVLEVGCGAGLMAQFFNCDYTGVDYSETLLEKHRSILGNNVSLAEANDLPFEENSFDYVITIGVFQYFPDENYVNNAISEMQRVAKKAIFIGDLPTHYPRGGKGGLTFSKEDFHEWDITPSCYSNSMFNVYKINS
tara:strand:- start:418 stop:984 length:567 start_codon:yes stop_codon:yes gene_type:complete